MARKMTTSMIAALLLAGVAVAQNGAVSVKQNYEQSFSQLYHTLGQQSACIKIKNVDWKRVGDEFLPRAKTVTTPDEFGLLCMELIARLKDSHAYLMDGYAKAPQIDFPRWTAGFSCLKDDRGQAVVYYVQPRSPAHKAGMKPGMVVEQTDGQAASKAIAQKMAAVSKYSSYSSDRYLQYHAYRWFALQSQQGQAFTLSLRDLKGNKKQVRVTADLEIGYLPRLPVPVEGISDGGGNIQWKILDGNIGYIYIRRIKNDLASQLDQAIAALAETQGLILDVRGNSGGGYDFKTAHYNFNADLPNEKSRPQYFKPIALLISPRCISSGENWSSWFVANKKATLFGTATAGSSGRKTVYDLSNQLFKVRFVVKAYRGYLDRPLEGRGLEPDVKIAQTAADLAQGIDTVLKTATDHLRSQADTE